MNTSDTNERNVRIHLLMTYLLFTVNLIWQTHDKSKKSYIFSNLTKRFFLPSFCKIYSLWYVLVYCVHCPYFMIYVYACRFLATSVGRQSRNVTFSYDSFQLEALSLPVTFLFYLTPTRKSMNVYTNAFVFTITIISVAKCRRFTVASYLYRLFMDSVSYIRKI